MWSFAAHKQICIPWIYQYNAKHNKLAASYSIYMGFFFFFYINANFRATSSLGKTCHRYPAASWEEQCSVGSEPHVSEALWLWSMFVWLTELTVAWSVHLQPGCRDYSVPLFIRPEPFKLAGVFSACDSARTHWSVRSFWNNTQGRRNLNDTV